MGCSWDNAEFKVVQLRVPDDSDGYDCDWLYRARWTYGDAKGCIDALTPKPTDYGKDVRWQWTLFAPYYYRQMGYSTSFEDCRAAALAQLKRILGNRLRRLCEHARIKTEAARQISAAGCVPKSPPPAVLEPMPAPRKKFLGVF